MTNPSTSLVNLLPRLWKHITYRRRLQIYALFLLVLITLFAEVMSIGAVIPFLGFLTAPDNLFAHPWVQFIVVPLGIQTPKAMLLPITVLFAAAAFFSGAMRFLLMLVQTKLGHAIGSDLSLSIYRRTLHQPYLVHISRSSSQVISGILAKGKTIVGSTLLPLMTIVSSVILLSAILIALLNIQPLVTALVFCGLGLIYILMILLLKRSLLNSSSEINKGHAKLLKLLHEGLGGIRDVLIDGTQAMHCKLYEETDVSMRKAMASVQVISATPRFGIEALGMVLIAILAYFFVGNNGGGYEGIPMLGALALGAQRALPLIQQCYSGWVVIRGDQFSLSEVLNLLDQPLPPYAKESEKLKFKKSVILRDVSLKFNPQSPEVLNSLNVEIVKGCRIGIIGSTGSGKSTFLDVVMGLLLPTSGTLLVDGVEINNETRRRWQKNIAHVPQSIYLADASVKENIAFGVPKSEIDMVRVKFVAKQAQLDNFIDSLNEKYETRVGERGVMLSGGQLQRIGIARALYKNTDFLILDEATSALDNGTESKLMEVIDSMGDDITMLIVAHRITTLRKCNQIIEIEAGKVKRIGTYSEIARDV